MGDEAAQAEAHRLLATDRLREADAPGTDAVDEHRLRALRAEIGVVHAADHHPHRPHQPRRDRLSRHYVPDLDVDEHPGRERVRPEMEEHHAQRRAPHRVRHTQEVAERRVADDARVRAERREEHEMHADAQQQQTRQRPEVLLKRGAAVEAPVDEHARKEQDHAVKQQHAPVGEGALRKVPVDQFAHGSHRRLVVFFRLSKAAFNKRGEE